MAPDASSSIQVRSEIGRLRRVLIHRPGLEIDWMVPSMMDRLLFDDILYGEDARLEHDQFRAVLHAAGVETLDPQGLLAEVLEDAELRSTAIDTLAATGDGARIGAEVIEELRGFDAGALATALVAGLRVGGDGPGGDRLRSFYRLAPLPNYFFQRDPQVVMGDSVLVSEMATDARAREAYLSSLVFAHHPALKPPGEHIRLHAADAVNIGRRALVEGGDVLVPRHDVLMIGVSERTNRHGVDSLAKHLLGRTEETGFRYIVAVEIPPKRSYMHLDTVFTFIDRGLCLAYLPVIAPGGAEAGTVYVIDLEASEVTYTLCDHVPGALKKVGLEIELVPCGGASSLIDQQREQWTDGANAFALAPGVLALYRRNRRTTEELSRRGFRIVEGADVIAGKEAMLDAGPTAVVLDDNELSRARGGPRCMTMPLLRDAVE
ncbi:MAG: arginine deiminase family protein [Acidobacteriota bacterium]